MDLLAALELQIEWGADEALTEVASDRFAAAPGAPSNLADAPIPVAAMPARTATVTVPAARLAGEAADMAALLDAYAGFDRCALRDTATSFVRPSGDPQAGLVWVTGPPNEDDDRTGWPASGADGALLDRILASIRLAREALLLVPILPWRPPGGRPPSAAECAVCLPFLHRLLALAQPHTLVLEAGLPAQTLLPRGASRSRRDSASVAAKMVLPELRAPVAVLTVPSLANIRQSAERRREAWAKVRLLRRHLDEFLAGN